MKVLKVIGVWLLITASIGVAEVSANGCGSVFEVARSGDAALRGLMAQVLKQYRVAGSAKENENLKHVRRMVKRVRENQEAIEELGVNAQVLEAAIYVSDMAKSPHLLKKYADHFGGNFFAAFLEHSRLSLKEANLMRKELGMSSKQWAEIVSGVLGHDGPSIAGTWWKANYEKVLGREYQPVISPIGVIHAYFDRLDQGGLYRQKNGQLDGGLRKISYDIFNGENPQKGDLVATLKETFGSVHEGTIPQLEYLDSVLVRKFFQEKGVPQFLREVRAEFDQSTEYFGRVEINEAYSDRVQIVKNDGTRVEVRDLDTFWRTLSAVSGE